MCKDELIEMLVENIIEELKDYSIDELKLFCKATRYDYKLMNQDILQDSALEEEDEEEVGICEEETWEE